MRLGVEGEVEVEGGCAAEDNKIDYAEYEVI